MNIYVGQLPSNVKESDLRELFSEYGEIASVKIPKDRYSGMMKNFAFIEMPDNSEADKAMKALNRTKLNGHEIKLTQVHAERGKNRLKRRRRY